MIQLNTLKDLARAKKYRRGACVSPDGAWLVVVLKGLVGVYRDGGQKAGVLVATIGPGELYGEDALFCERCDCVRLSALAETVALTVSRGEAASFLRDESEFALKLARELCSRMEALRAEYEKLSGKPWQPPKLRAELAAPPAAAAEPPAAPEPLRAEPARVPSHEKRARQPVPPEEPAPLLFPEGHGLYELPKDKQDPALLMDRSFACPCCKADFTARAVRESRLAQESVDGDMRRRYKGIEPLYYDVVTCPRCLYSALAEHFSSPDVRKADLSFLSAYQKQAEGLIEGRGEAASVFAGYYLALLCAPKCFASNGLISAKLLLKLSRVYSDCGDAEMENQTARRALEAYLAVYMKEQGGPEQDQQLCVAIGELYLKLGDVKNARDYFFKAKVSRGGIPVLKLQAEARLGEIRTLTPTPPP